MLPSAHSSPSSAYVTHTLARGPFSKAVHTTGTLKPVTVFSVGTQISGPVKKVHVEINQPVTKGQLMAEIDPALLVSQIEQTQAQLRSAEHASVLAQRNAVRLEALLKEGFVSKADWENAVQSQISAASSVEVTRAQLARDQQNLSYARVVSPADGVVIAANVTEGQTMQASFQTPELFQVAEDLKRMKLELKIGEQHIAAVKVGQKVRFRVDAYEDTPFEGVVEKVRLSPDTQQGEFSGGGVKYTVMVAVNNADLRLFVGMTAYVDIIIEEHADVLLLPDAALRYAQNKGEQEGHVLVDEGGTPRAHAVTVHNSDGTVSHVDSDTLKEGMKVIIREEMKD